MRRNRWNNCTRARDCLSLLRLVWTTQQQQQHDVGDLTLVRRNRVNNRDVAPGSLSLPLRDNMSDTGGATEGSTGKWKGKGRSLAHPHTLVSETVLRYWC
jgi:hypothetical protein